MRRFARAAAIGWLTVLPLVSALGCAHDPPEDPHAPTNVTLVNDMGTWYELWLVQGAQRVDMGRVDAKSTRTFKVPSEMSFHGSRVVLVAVPALGGYAFRKLFIANPGTRVGLRFPS